MQSNSMQSKVGYRLTVKIQTLTDILNAIWHQIHVFTNAQ